MKLFLASLSLIALCLTLSAIPAMAQSDLYDNGPINGQITGWTIDFGFSVSDSFTLANPATVDGISFGLFLFPGDTLTSAEVQIGGGPFGNQLFDETINFTASNCFVDQFGYNICQETGSFSGLALNAGTYWMTLSNASVPSGDPVFWDQNSGMGCQGSGCPSMAPGKRDWNHSLGILHHPGQHQLNFDHGNDARAREFAAAGIGNTGHGRNVAKKTVLTHFAEGSS